MRPSRWPKRLGILLAGLLLVWAILLMGTATRPRAHVPLTVTTTSTVASSACALSFTPARAIACIDHLEPGTAVLAQAFYCSGIADPTPALGVIYHVGLTGQQRWSWRPILPSSQRACSGAILLVSAFGATSDGTHIGCTSAYFSLPPERPSLS